MKAYTYHLFMIGMAVLVKDEVIFGRKLRLNRVIKVWKVVNEFRIYDAIENTGYRTVPLEILYNMNMGYPPLDADGIVEIPSAEVIPRNAHAAKDLETYKRPHIATGVF